MEGGRQTHILIGREYQTQRNKSTFHSKAFICAMKPLKITLFHPKRHKPINANIALLNSLYQFRHGFLIRRMQGQPQGAHLEKKYNGEKRVVPVTQGMVIATVCHSNNQVRSYNSLRLH